MKKNLLTNLGFMLSLFFLMAIMYWSGSFFDEFVIKDKEESYVFKLTVQLNDLLRSLKNESTEQRISMSSGNQSNMASYRAAVDKVDENLARIRSLTQGKPQYRLRFAQIVPLIEKRRVLLDRGLENGIQDPGVRGLIREIRHQIGNLKDQLLIDLRESSALQQKSLKRMRLMMIVKSIAVAVLFSAVFLLLRKDIARREREEVILTRDRDQLDELVLRRTEELVTANELLKHEMEIRKQAEHALHNLNRHTELIREEERRTISRDIHDEIGQSLTAVKLDLAWIEHKFLPGNTEFAGRLSLMRSFLDRLIGKVQNIVAGLRPPLLDSLGLVEAMDWQVKEFKRQNSIVCELSIDEKVKEVDEKVATAVVRIVMEALTNVSRHAQATMVSVSLRVRDKAILLDIHDNGRGLTSEEINSPTSYGLLGMQERAHLCDGTLTFESEPGQGTTVSLSIPPAQSREES